MTQPHAEGAPQQLPDPDEVYSRRKQARAALRPPKVEEE